MTEAEITKKHLTDLDERAFSHGYTVFSEFLNMDQISTLKSLSTRSAVTLFGGYENAERCVAGFGEEIADEDFPIVCLRLAPLSQKFSDKLTHRDFLGALMNLGIERHTLGDIKIKDNTGYLFCLVSIADYIEQNLTRIRHTTITAERIDSVLDFINEKPEASTLIVPSERADAVIAGVYKLSRNGAAALFRAGKIFINARLCEKEAVTLKEGDIISVRGYGKFIYDGVERSTKKDRMVISVRVYR